MSITPEEGYSHKYQEEMEKYKDAYILQYYLKHGGYCAGIFEEK